MRPAQVRFVVIGFLVALIATSLNALHFQQGRHPAPLNTAAGKAESIAPRRSQAQESLRGPDAPDRGLVRALQRELASRGYAAGPIDGVFGPVTQAALMAFEYDAGLQVSGEASEKRLSQIVFGSAKPAKSPGRYGSKPMFIVRQVQKVLAEQGYAPGPIDGLFGAATRKAIEKFERDHGLEPKGRISGRLIERMIKVTGRDFRQPMTG